MAEDYKSYRIRTDVGGKDSVLNVKLTQTYDTLEVLSLKIDQTNSYKIYKSDYGVVVGRVFANGGYGVPNVKVSAFIAKRADNVFDEDILYPYISTKSLGVDGVRYNLLPQFVDVACHQDVGTFPTKRYVLDNDDVIEIFDKYYTYTTTTNNAGDYMLFGVPTGTNKIHIDVDLSDVGVLSQKPRDFLFKGYNIEQFDSPTKFKSSTNLSSLAQIISEDKDVYVYSYWGDTSETDSDIAITRCDFELAYKFEPTCIFMGSVITDMGSNAISKHCVPDVKSGQMSELATGSGRIEMIRKTFDNKVEQFAVNGNQNIDENGIWCYQIPMNLDYVITDEFGSIVPSNNPEKGIPTRTRVRFRISMNEMPDDGKARNRCYYLVPNNPRFDDRYESFSKTKTVDYEFGTMTKDENYCDLFWNNVYTVKNYIPRLQKNTHTKHGRNFSGIKLISHYGDNSPMPYNQVTTRMSIGYIFLCNIFKFILDMLTALNGIISYVIGGIIGTLAAPFCALAKVKIVGIRPFGFFNPVCKAFKKLIPSCIGIDGSFCADNVTHSYTYYPGCGDFSSSLGIGAWTNTIQSHTKNQNEKIRSGEMTNEERTQPNKDSKATELRNCIETNLAEEYNVISFNFNNDWVNGVLYLPLWFRKITKKKRYFFGLFSRPATDLWCSAELNDTSEQLRIVQPCAFNREKITKACGNKNENCLTTKGIIGLRHGIVVPKETMLGQTVYYYSACEIGGADIEEDEAVGASTTTENQYNRIKLLFATDIVLLGSLNDNDLNGIPQFFKSLENTTYKMPPTVLQTVNNVTSDIGDDASVTYTQVSNTEYTGRDWGNANNDLCNGSKGSKDGGLFYGIGCSSTQMTPKSCVNVSRICEFGVSLDEDTPVISRELNRYSDNTSISSTFDFITPDGYISYDEINNETQRSAFATLNGNFLRTKINEKNGLREYVFKYMLVDNFDGSLSDLMAAEQEKCTKLQKYNYLLESKSQGYIDFRFGDKATWYKKDAFPRYENSFYFYFGLKEGKTALDKLYKYYVSDCADTAFADTPVDIMVRGNDWCCTSKTIIDTEQKARINDYNGYVAFNITGLELPCTILMQQEGDDQGINEREFVAQDEKVYIATQRYTENACQYGEEELVATPIISGSGDSVNNNTFTDKLTVTITCETEGVVHIFYTIDTEDNPDDNPEVNTEPSNASTRYTGTFNINQTATIKAIAYLLTNEETDYTNAIASKIAEQKFEKIDGSQNIGALHNRANSNGSNDNYIADLKGYKKICKDINDNNLLMVANGVYDINITDGTGNIYTTRITIGQSTLNTIITPTNFDNNRISGRFNPRSMASNNAGLEGSPSYATTLTRTIGGTINISIPKDGDSDEILANFIITIECAQKNLGYNVSVSSTNYQLQVNAQGYKGTLLYPQVGNDGYNTWEHDLGGFVFGLPAGDTTYKVTVMQTCGDDNTQTSNIVVRELFITDKTQYKLYINDVDYDVIKHWKCGFEVKSLNYFANEASISETGDISSEWFNLSNEDNYHWFESKDYNTIDKELVQLVKEKYDIFADLFENTLLADAYNELVSSISEDENRKQLLDLERRVNNDLTPNYLYVKTSGDSAIYTDLDVIKSALLQETETLNNKCINEVRKDINYDDYVQLPEKGKSAYEKVYQNFYDDTDYSTEDQIVGLDTYTLKTLSFYPYEYLSMGNDTGVNDTIKYYGFVDMPEHSKWSWISDNTDVNYDPDSWRNPNHLRHYTVLAYIGVNYGSTTNNREGDISKYIPYSYVGEDNNTSGHCASKHVNINETYERYSNKQLSSFIDPGYFEINGWIDVTQDEFRIDEDNTICGTEGSGACGDCNTMPFLMYNRKTKEYLSYLGYNTIQYTNRSADYERKSYVKVTDIVEYENSDDKENYEVYQYIEIKTTTTQTTTTQTKIPYCIKNNSDNSWRYYDNNIGENDTVYYVEVNGDNVAKTISLNQYANLNLNDKNDYLPQYIIKDDKHMVTYAPATYNQMPMYGAYAYGVNTDKAYREKRNDGTVSDVFISESVYDGLEQNGKNKCTPKTYLPVSVNDTEDHKVEKEAVSVSNTGTTVFDYMWEQDTEPKIFDNGTIITLSEYEYLGRYQEYCKPRYLAEENDSQAQQVTQYFIKIDDEDNGLTEEELQNLPEYSKKFYQIDEYKYTLTEDDFNRLSSDVKRYYRREKVNGENKYYYIISKDDFDTANKKEQGEKIIELDDIGNINIEDLGNATLTPVYANIVNPTNKISEDEFTALPKYMYGDYEPFIYVGEDASSITLSPCSESEDANGGVFSSIIGADEQMLEYITSLAQFKSDFIIAAKSAFWMTCSDSTNMLSYRVETEDRPVDYHLVYKEEVYKEDDLNETEYNGLSDVEYYAHDGTSDIIVTIPTICMATDEEWGNNCHKVPGYNDLCYARDNSEGLCANGIFDKFWRKAFFVGTVNGKNDVIPEGETQSIPGSNGKVRPTKFFGVHVVDKRLVNNVIAWANISGIPKFYTNADEGNDAVEVNMFGSISGFLRNGIVDATLNEYKYGPSNELKGCLTHFETQNVGGKYDLDIFTPVTNGTLNDDTPGIGRFIVSETKVLDDNTNTIAIPAILKDEIYNDVLYYDENLENVLNTTYREENGSIKDEIISTFKPYENYRIVDDGTDNVYQYAILPPSRMSLAIEDKFGCGISTTIDGNLRLTLNKKSINDSTCVRWGGSKLFTDCDESYIKIDLVNGDIEDYTFYAFEVIDNPSSYPLNSADTIEIGEDTKTPIRYIDMESNNDELITDKSFKNNSTYLFAPNTQPSFSENTNVNMSYYRTDVAILVYLGYIGDLIDTTFIVKNCADIDYAESSSSNKDVFLQCQLYKHSYLGDNDSYACTLGSQPTTPLLYSASDDVNFVDLLNVRNHAGVRRKEQFISSMARKHKSYATHDEHAYYKPIFDSLVDDSGNPIAETMDIGEYNEYLGFSHNGEFGLRAKFGLLVFNSTVCNKDDCDETKNANGDKVYTAYFTVDRGGVLNTEECHKPFYIVAISNDGVSRAISPVYDFRLMKVQMAKVRVDNKYYYKVSVKLQTDANAYYFYHYDYTIVDYLITFGYLTGDGENLTPHKWAETTFDGINRPHIADKHASDTVALESLIPYPVKTSEYSDAGAAGTWPTGDVDMMKKDQWFVDGYVTLLDTVGLKHKIPINNVSVGQLVGNYWEEGNTDPLTTYTLETEGGIWKYVKGAPLQIPQGLINTSLDYVLTTSFTYNELLTKLPGVGEEFKDQIVKKRNGLDYKLESWVNSGNTFTAGWVEPGVDVNNMCYIMWIWQGPSGPADVEYTKKELALKDYDGITKPDSVTPSTQQLSNNTVFQHLWRIRRKDGTYYTMADDGTFVADLKTYEYVNEPYIDNTEIEIATIRVYAVYDQPEYLTAYLIDNFLMNRNDIYIDGVYVGQGIKKECSTGTAISDLHPDNDLIDNLPSYWLHSGSVQRPDESWVTLGWYNGTSGNETDTVQKDNTMVYCRWCYKYGFVVVNAINISDIDEGTDIFNALDGCTNIGTVFIDYRVNNEFIENDAYENVNIPSSGSQAKMAEKQRIYDDDADKYLSPIGNTSIKRIFFKLYGDDGSDNSKHWYWTSYINDPDPLSHIDDTGETCDYYRVPDGLKVEFPNWSYTGDTYSTDVDYITIRIFIDKKENG